MHIPKKPYFTRCVYFQRRRATVRLRHISHHPTSPPPLAALALYCNRQPTPGTRPCMVYGACPERGYGAQSLHRMQKINNSMSALLSFVSQPGSCPRKLSSQEKALTLTWCGTDGCLPKTKDWGNLRLCIMMVIAVAVAMHITVSRQKYLLPSAIC